MNGRKENTGEDPITPPPSYFTVVDERSHQYGFAPYPVTQDQTEQIHRIPMPMPMPTPASMPMPMPMPTPASMPMPMPGSRVIYESHFDDDEPRESASTSYGIAERFRTARHSPNRSGTNYNRAVATHVSHISFGSSSRDATVHVFPQKQERSDYKSALCCALAIGLVVCGILVAISVSIRASRARRL